MKVKLTSSSRLLKTRPDDVIIVPMGAYLPHAVRVTSVHADFDGQLIATGTAVQSDGCSNYRIGSIMGVCLGYIETSAKNK